MMHMGLSLLTVALETGCEHISNFSALLSLVKDEMCKNVFAVSMGVINGSCVCAADGTMLITGQKGNQKNYYQFG